ncbi:MAG: hypothetical protein A2047_02060 [Omnitrophica bacterium GWA2_41_15]|nr:MAG: hypothetical protein A2047_02060 [Omnitrophica bacterium GWA2_41_15]
MNEEDCFNIEPGNYILVKIEGKNNYVLAKVKKINPETFEVESDYGIHQLFAYEKVKIRINNYSKPCPLTIDLYKKIRFSPEGYEIFLPK